MGFSIALAGLALSFSLTGRIAEGQEDSDPPAASLDFSAWPAVIVLEQTGVSDVERRLKEGEDANASNGNGWAPLHYAAWRGDAGIIEVLLESGASVAARNDDGATPLHVAAIAPPDLPSLEVGINAGTQKKLRLTEQRVVAVEVIQVLLEAGADPNAGTIIGMTPVHWAVVGGHTLAIAPLAEAGADLDVHDKHGITPLHQVASRCNFEMAKALVEAGADVHRPRAIGHTPLHTAAWNGCSNIIPLLISAGAVVDGTIHAATPLHFAIDYSGDPASVEALLQAGANPNAINGFNKTPMDISLWKKKLYLGFISEVTDKQRKEFYEELVQNHEEIVSLLEAAGGRTAQSLISEQEGVAAEPQ